VKLGFNTVIMEDVQIGANCLIGQIGVHEGTIIGESVRIDDNVITVKSRCLRRVASSKYRIILCPPGSAATVRSAPMW
jgi:UDP-3-O-[3-hydroxymyristoyl] glucosamine N-acyltransferase